MNDYDKREDMNHPDNLDSMDRLYAADSFGSYKDSGEEAGDNPYLRGYERYAHESDRPLNKRGREIPNRFGLKLVLSIIEIPFSLIFGILALVFTCMQNSSYKRGDWAEFKSRKTISTVMLWIGGVISLLVLAIITVSVMIAMYAISDDAIMKEMLQTIGVDESFLKEIDEELSLEELVGQDSYEEISLENTDRIIIDGNEIVIPMEAAEFLSITREELLAEEGDVIEKGKEAYYETDYFVLDLYNTGETDIAPEEAVIGGFDFYFGLDGENELYRFTYLEVLNEKSTLEDYIAVLGDSYQNYRNDGLNEYCWYTPDGWISVIYDDSGIPYCLSINNYGALMQ